MYAIRIDGADNGGYQWLSLLPSSVRFQTYLNLSCIRDTEDSTTRWIKRFQRRVELKMANKKYDEHRSTIPSEVEIYFQLKNAKVVLVEDFDRLLNYSFKPSSRQLLSSTTYKTPYCSVCGSSIFPGHRYVFQPSKGKTTGCSNICVFCLKDAHDELCEDIAKIPPDILEEFLEHRQANIFLTNL